MDHFKIFKKAFLTFDSPVESVTFKSKTQMINKIKYMDSQTLKTSYVQSFAKYIAVVCAVLCFVKCFVMLYHLVKMI